MNITSNAHWLCLDSMGRRQISFPRGLVHNIQPDVPQTFFGIRYRKDSSVLHPNQVFVFVQDSEGVINVRQFNPEAKASDYMICIWGGWRGPWFRLRALARYRCRELHASMM